MREEVFLLGRILFSLVFIGSGIGHLTQTAASAQFAAYKKVPSPTLAVQASGVAMLLGGAAIVFGFWMDLAALGLAIVLVAMAAMMHRFWEETDPQTKQGEMAHFMKNIALAGGALVLVALPVDWYTLTDGVF